MTLRVVIDRRNVYVFRESRFQKISTYDKFDVPYSFEQFMIWYDIANLKPKKVSFECAFSHRKLCMISRKKFESQDFPELDYIKKLMLGEAELTYE